MSARDGMVPVAKAAEMLTAMGDRIDASNVSRYLARFPEIPQRKDGKYRFVDVAALARHRSENILVHEKRAARDIAPLETEPEGSGQPSPVRKVPPASSPLLDASAAPDAPDTDAGGTSSPIALANLELKQLQIREARLDLEEREGKLVPDHEVMSLITTVMQTFVDALLREETEITQEMGRDVGAAFRRARKSAQARAAKKLAEIAGQHLPDHLAHSAPVALEMPLRM